MVAYLLLGTCTLYLFNMQTIIMAAADQTVMVTSDVGGWKTTASQSDIDKSANKLSGSFVVETIIIWQPVVPWWL